MNEETGSKRNISACQRHKNTQAALTQYDKFLTKESAVCG